MKSSFWQAGHRPTLIAAFLYFDLAFMVWVILGPLAPAISEDLGLTPAQKGLMVAVPTLAGAILRVVNGLLVDRIGPKRAGAISQLIVILGLFTAWLTGVESFAGTLALGIILGFAGASFATPRPLLRSLRAVRGSASTTSVSWARSDFVRTARASTRCAPKSPR